MRGVACAAILLLAGCSTAPVRPRAPAPVPAATRSTPLADTPPAAPAISWVRVDEPADLPDARPPAGHWRVHLIDVGTGLAILVEGADFTMLYDAGTHDPVERPIRVLAYLARALGPSGDELCVEPGAPTPSGHRTIDHVVLSHPHLDHASALDLVLHCFEVRHVWDGGAVHEAVFYRDFLAAVARETGATFHTAAPPPADRTVVVRGVAVAIPIAWETFSEGDVVELGASARFTILHGDGKRRRDPNGSSLVLAVELGGARLLLTGDAESGRRADPAAAPGDVEAHLLDHAAPAIDADVLQVAHHGSKTSSRRAFLDAVTPSLALVSAGPRAYRGTTLPDPEVIAALEAVGATVLRTDEHDDGCPWTPIGPARGPGGCDSWIVTIVSGAAGTSPAPRASSGSTPGASATRRRP